jgi:hypothetical protein
MFDQHQNLRDAIRRKKAKLAEIEAGLSRPLPSRNKWGMSAHVSQSSRLRLQEERLHLEEAIAELEAEDKRLLGQEAGGSQPPRLPTHDRRGSTRRGGGKQRPDQAKGFDGLGRKKQDLSRYLDAAELTEKQQSCFSLRFEYGLSQREVGRRLGLHHSVVGEYVEAANKKLERCGQQVASGKRKAKLPSD